jgi:hypothetical protein
VITEPSAVAPDARNALDIEYGQNLRGIHAYSCFLQKLVITQVDKASGATELGSVTVDNSLKPALNLPALCSIPTFKRSSS